jgi:hypothetical protein
MLQYYRNMSPIGSEALIPNPELAPFQVFIGRCKTEGSHAFIPGVVLHGRTSFEWTEGGSFLVMRSEIDDPRIPSATAIISSDNVLKKYAMLYFDERGISRIFEVSIGPNTWTWFRNAPGFSQRFTCTLSQDQQTMIGVSELCTDDTTWEKDLELTYTRMD